MSRADRAIVQFGAEGVEESPPPSPSPSFTGQPWLPLVFAYLGTADLFRFRGVSREGRCQVDDYCRRLSRLELSDTAKTRFSWAHFQLITRHNNACLRSLSLVDVSWVDEDDFACFLRRQPRLHSVDLSRAYRISNATLLTLAQTCPAVERLHLRHCSWLSEATFLQMITHHPQCGLQQLVEVDLSSCWNLTDHSIGLLFTTHGSTLRRVTLAGLYSLTDGWTVDIDSRASCLTYLDISSCWRMTDSAIE